jgi:hypothetical protein
MTQNPKPSGFIDRLVERMNGWSKTQRMTISILVTVILITILALPLDQLLDPLSTGSGTIFTFTIILLGTGLYALGWYWLLGFNPDELRYPAREAVYFVLAGVMGIPVVIGGLVYLVTTAF